jgi:lipopolysaccharide export system permease protein
MFKLRRHVGMHVFSAVMLMVVVLAGMFGVAELADEITGAPEGYSLLRVMAYVAMRVPGMAVDNMGFAMLLGCLLGLGVLGSQSELTVMRASGVSVLHIVWMVLRPMLLVMLVAACLGEFVIPQLNRYAEIWYAKKGQSADPSVAVMSQGGLWLRQENDFFHFNRILPNGEIHGFSQIHFADSDILSSVTYAPKAFFDQGGWRLENARVTTIEGQQVKAVVDQANLRWDNHLGPELLSLVVSEPANMSVRELFAYLQYLTKQVQDGRQFELMFWQKALSPLGMIGLVLVGISFVFGPLRSTTMGYRLFTGIMIGVFFRFAQELLGPMSLVFGFPPWLAVAGPILFCWAVGLGLLQKTR